MKRFRELRKDQATRDKYADVSLSAADFIYPYFVVEGENQKEEISTILRHLSLQHRYPSEGHRGNQEPRHQQGTPLRSDSR